MWIRGTPPGRLISKASGVNDQDHWLMLSVLADRTLRFRLKTSSDDEDQTVVLVASSGAVQDDQWHHVGATYDGSAMRLYLDGAEVGSLAAGGLIAEERTHPVVFGAGGGAPYEYDPFVGLLDDIRIYQSALDRSGVQGVMAANGAPPPPPQPGAAQSQVPETFKGLALSRQSWAQRAHSSESWIASVSAPLRAATRADPAR